MDIEKAVGRLVSFSCRHLVQRVHRLQSGTETGGRLTQLVLQKNMR